MAESLTLERLPRNERGIAQAIALLQQRFGERLATASSVREQHGHTTTWLPNQMPDAVLFAETTEDVVAAVRIAAEHRVPIIPFGVGTSLEGHLNAPAGGISVDVSRMNRVLAVHPEDLNCEIEPGVTRRQLNDYLRDQGLFFPIDPGADASLGGMAATRASGTNAVRYGTMRDNVINLTVVLPDGRVIRTASRAKKSAAGYDLTRLFVGSEGTLGVITGLTLRLYGIPEAIAAGVCAFPTVDDACNAAILTNQSGLPVARIELADANQIRASNLYSKLGLPEKPHLFLEFHGSEAGVHEQSTRFGQIAADCGAGAFTWAVQPEDRSRLWRARHDAYFACQVLRPGARVIATDACVPISRLADCVGETMQDIKDMGLVATIVGHVGDGNFHVQLMIDTGRANEVAQARSFIGRLNARAIGMDGTCTGEHGVGQGKVDYVVSELGAGVDVMRAIKAAIDPSNIMNPGKIMPQA